MRLKIIKHINGDWVDSDGNRYLIIGLINGTTVATNSTDYYEVTADSVDAYAQSMGWASWQQ